MEEDMPGEYEDRIIWMLDEIRVRQDREACFNNKGTSRMSTRSLNYRNKFLNENLTEKIEKTRFKRQAD
jgi:hypothetical protein